MFHFYPAWHFLFSFWASSFLSERAVVSQLTLFQFWDEALKLWYPIKVYCISCIQCNSTIDGNCLKANVPVTQCPNVNYTACSKFYHNSDINKAIFRGCAPRKLYDQCYSEPNLDGTESETCLYWCDDFNGCNTANARLYSHSKAKFIVLRFLGVVVLVSLVERLKFEHLIT